VSENVGAGLRNDYWDMAKEKEKTQEQQIKGNWKIKGKE
jgi:hypothetical protein